MKKPDKDDVALFRNSIGSVKPVTSDRVTKPRRKPVPRPRSLELDESEVLIDMLSDEFEPAEMENGDELLYVRPGIQKRTLRKLRRGMLAVDGELDLHGMTVPVARQAVSWFLHECQRRHTQCVRIIHGKGLGSRHRGPVLKKKVDGWLRQRSEVLAYCSARVYDGGTGAVYVLLKRN